MFVEKLLASPRCTNKYINHKLKKFKQINSLNTTNRQICIQNHYKYSKRPLMFWSSLIISFIYKFSNILSLILSLHGNSFGLGIRSFDRPSLLLIFWSPLNNLILHNMFPNNYHCWSHYHKLLGKYNSRLG